MAGDISKIQTPTYDYEIAKLRGYYDEALSKVSRELLQLGLTNFERTQIIATQKEIKKVLAELAELASDWIATNIPVAATDGVAISLISLGLAETIGEERGIKVNKLNREFIKTAVTDTQDDLLQITQTSSARCGRRFAKTCSAS
ncbi:hypothetical protein Q8G35_03325 [Peribacillus simplex]|uniref:Uncharacterized protein n=2 Tax=Peribacillus TaxID=2675229 RepID=A0AA90P0K4_9BACI|nr:MULTISPECIES: hypothetical protein [Peribacillus]MDP1417436.1 hypothetical protein [Peribacillus simplex]MDP1450091.1 hypothetical protein [Peribacillus frigoritolerans]